VTADFVAGILTGFEDTLDQVLARVPEPWLRREVEELRAQIAGKRESLESGMACSTVQQSEERTLS
jgi:hypothetical protein